MEEKPNYHLDNGSAFRFLSFAAIADIITFIPGAGDVVSEIFWPLAILYLWKKGLGLVNFRRLAIEGVSFVAELIPGIQEFPTIFIASVAIVVMSRAQDKTGIKMMGKGSVTKLHLNNNGTRLPPPPINAQTSPEPLNSGNTRLPRRE